MYVQIPPVFYRTLSPFGAEALLTWEFFICALGNICNWKLADMEIDGHDIYALGNLRSVKYSNCDWKLADTEIDMTRHIQKL